MNIVDIIIITTVMLAVIVAVSNLCVRRQKKTKLEKTDKIKKRISSNHIVKWKRIELSKR